jgi:hypothetical protein
MMSRFYIWELVSAEKNFRSVFRSKLSRKSTELGTRMFARA